MEWDIFWAFNRQGYEHSAPRYMALFKDTAVRMVVEGGPDGNAGMTIPLHPKYPERGSRWAAQRGWHVATLCVASTEF
jgi:hypothetical protein